MNYTKCKIFSDIFSYNPGIWVLYEFDGKLNIWYRNKSRYLVPFDKSCVIDINNGNMLTQNDIDNLEIMSDEKRYFWMQVYELNSNIL